MDIMKDFPVDVHLFEGLEGFRGFTPITKNSPATDKGNCIHHQYDGVGVRLCVVDTNKYKFFVAPFLTGKRVKQCGEKHTWSVFSNDVQNE